MNTKVVPFDEQNFQKTFYIVIPTVVFDFLVVSESVSVEVGAVLALNRRFPGFESIHKIGSKSLSKENVVFSFL